MIPKFRAWDVHNKEMFTNDQLIIWDGNIYANDPGEISVDKMRGWSIDEKYLMQSTGLFDKNGVEIFEGDIVEQKVVAPTGEDEDEEDLVGVVTYIDGSFYIMNDEELRAKELFSEVQVNTVIGNIYENPELVEEE